LKLRHHPLAHLDFRPLRPTCSCTLGGKLPLNAPARNDPSGREATHPRGSDGASPLYVEVARPPVWRCRSRETTLFETIRGVEKPWLVVPVGLKPTEERVEVWAESL